MPSLHICVANKRLADAVYWSRVDIHQLKFFLELHDWSPSIRAHVQHNESKLKHLRWDLGADFQADLASHEAGNFTFIKSGIYGTF